LLLRDSLVYIENAGAVCPEPGATYEFGPETGPDSALNFLPQAVAGDA
jgi:hypothetical protein